MREFMVDVRLTKSFGTQFSTCLYTFRAEMIAKEATPVAVAVMIVVATGFDLSTHKTSPTFTVHSACTGPTSKTRKS